MTPAQSEEIVSVHEGPNMSRLFMAVITALCIGAVFGGVTAWSDGRITAAELANHKSAEEARLAELKTDIRSLRDELRGDLQDIRQAVERRR